MRGAPVFPARVALRGGTWYCDDTPCGEYRAALRLALDKAEMLPQPGNSERGSAQVFEARLAWRTKLRWRSKGAGA